jgi:hypothetical protein
MSGSFEAPTTLQGLTRVLNNYSRLLEVLFGSDCPHLDYVVQLRDGLIQHERVLEGSITQTLMIHLLWKVHQDARHFFTLCERWEVGENLPRSHLGHAVHELVADINISGTITCPVAQFLGLVGNSAGIPPEFRGIPVSGPFFQSIFPVWFPIPIGKLIPAIFLIFRNPFPP